MAAKRPINDTSKVNRHTDTHTHTQTDTYGHIWTFGLIESIGPEGRCFEKKDTYILNCICWVWGVGGVGVGNPRILTNLAPLGRSMY